MMPDILKNLRTQFAEPVLNVLRITIYGPDPSEPYSWVGSIRKDGKRTPDGRTPVGYESIC